VSGKAIALAQWSASPEQQEIIAMSDPEPTKEELLRRIAELEQQVAVKKPASLEFRVSEKGAVSVYGLGRFPVTLYYEQWSRLLGHADELRAFIEKNKGKLKQRTRTEE